MPRKTKRTRCGTPKGAVCFNEAAARCRGKLPVGILLDPPYLTASMRPRPDAAENCGLHRPGSGRDAGFNEAAARCRGKLPGNERAEPPISRASMRPRPDAAENCAFGREDSVPVAMLQ